MGAPPHPNQQAYHCAASPTVHEKKEYKALTEEKLTKRATPLNRQITTHPRCMRRRSTRPGW